MYVKQHVLTSERTFKAVSKIVSMYLYTNKCVNRVKSVLALSACVGVFL